MDTEDSGHELDPILRSELSTLKVQLKNGPIEERRQAFDQLCELGQAARPLIPMVLSMVNQRSSWLTPCCGFDSRRLAADILILK